MGNREVFKAASRFPSLLIPVLLTIDLLRVCVSFPIPPWKFWELWCFFFISSVLVRETSVFQQSSVACNSFTQPKIQYGKEPKGGSWLAYFWQKSCPQFLQWWRLSVSEKRTAQPEQLSPPSSFTQWSAADRPGWSLTDQLNTLPRPSPIRILLWSLQEKSKNIPATTLAQ